MIGDIGGVITKLSGKVLKGFGKALSPALKIVNYGDEVIDILKFGARFGFMLELFEIAVKYGDEMADIARYLAKHGGKISDAIGELSSTSPKIAKFMGEHGDLILKYGDTLAKYGDDLAKAFNSIQKNGEKFLRFIKFGMSDTGKIAAFGADLGGWGARKEIDYTEEELKNWINRYTTEQINKVFGSIPSKEELREQRLGDWIDRAFAQLDTI